MYVPQLSTIKRSSPFYMGASPGPSSPFPVTLNTHYLANDIKDNTVSLFIYRNGGNGGYPEQINY